MFSSLLIIAIAKVDNVAKYKAYRQGWKNRPVVQTLLHETVIFMASGGGSSNLTVSRIIFGIIR